MLRVTLLFCCLISDVTLPFENKDFDDDSYSYYYYDEAIESTVFPATDLTRVRRHSEATRTPNPEDLQGLRGALKQIMSGRRIDDWESDSLSTQTLNKQNITKNYYNTMTNEVNSLTTTQSDGNLTPKPDYDSVPPKYDNLTPKFRSDFDSSEYNMLTQATSEYNSLTTMKNNISMAYDWIDITTKVPVRTTLKNQNNETENRQEKLELMSYIDSMEGNSSGESIESISEQRAPIKLGLRTKKSTTRKKTPRRTKRTKRKTTTPTTTTTRPTTTKPVQFDIEKFLEIVANLTYDYYTNLTEQVNATLIKMSVPTCGTPTTTTTEGTTTPSGPVDYRFMKENLMGKCFVCGLEEQGIPYNAHCADAFAGDFIPLVPQDPSAKRHITRYKKYCRYQDINNFLLNDTMPRSVFGRWTGGCSVRWTDLSGVYTQRSCRNRRQAATGRHFASKRMAKLEMALSNLDNGCIISPVASLLPLSRGISLFSRFHACVCTGNWCNSSFRVDSDVWMTFATILTAVVF